MCKPLIIIGAGGHGKVVLDSAVKAGFAVEGFLDDNFTENEILGFKLLGAISDVNKFTATHIFVCAVGSNAVRSSLDASKNINWATIIHPASHIGLDVEIGKGTVIMAGAVVNVSTRIGRHCIINTGSVIDHDCIISDYTHVSPGAVLCGKVIIEERAWIGARVVIKNGISVCAETIVGAGAVVVKDINEKGTYIGVPAKKYKVNADLM